MNAVILYRETDLEKNRPFEKLLHRAFAARGISSRTIKYEDLAAPGALKTLLRDRPSLVLNRTRDPRLARFLSSRGLRVSNSPLVCALGNDKWLSCRFARGLGIPVMDTVCVSAGKTEDLPDFPLVLKSRTGHGGSEVFLVRDKEELKERLSSPSLKGKRLILQRLSDEPGRDVRVYILGGEILAAVERMSRRDFRSNFSLGGEIALTELSREETELVRKFTDALSIDFCGIDLIYDEGRPVFNELEDMVGSRSLYALTDRDIAAEVVGWLGMHIQRDP